MNFVERMRRKLAGTPSADAPIGLDQVLQEEDAHLTRAGAPPPTERAALCLSGGGIRSASFALGVLQALGARDLLRQFDYLSTVSGGGYTGGWLAAWLHHDKLTNASETAFDRLRKSGSPDLSSVEPEPVQRVRANSRFMSPATGFFSADMWTLIATVARNLVLNWFVLLPLLAAALLVPRFYQGILQAAYRPLDGSAASVTDPAFLLTALAGGLVVIAQIFAGANLPSYGNRQASQSQFFIFALAPLCLAVLVFTLVIAATRNSVTGLWSAVGGGGLLVGVAWAATGLLTGTRRWRPCTWMAASMSGAVGAGLMWKLADALPRGAACEPWYAIAMFPLSILILELAGFLFMGLAGEDISDDDLEWWGRSNAWLATTAAAWLLVSALVFKGPAALFGIRDFVASAVGMSSRSATGVVGVGTSVLGAISAFIGRTVMSQKTSSTTGLVKKTLFALAAPAFGVTLLAGIASANDEALRQLRLIAPPAETIAKYCHGDTLLSHVLLLGLLYGGVGWLMGRFVPVNKFSLHGMYRNRLIRTFLGASRPDASRHPNPFTGFDPADNVQMCDLKKIGRPFLVVNITLNKVAEASLGWLHRKAESFTATPLHAGSPSLSYRPIGEYASNPQQGTQGISLGTAMTISGAAASPNMGSSSSPSLTFLLTLFNARLGIWLGNPGPAGEQTWRTGEPKQDAGPIVREMLGLTTDQSPYVYLSDGGHFENLGISQMVRRRCRYILVSDASCDGEYTFEDLATSIRQIRIDLGVPIVFEQGTGMDRQHQGNGNPHFAVARVLYSEVDGADAPEGILIYVKATLCGREPVDVLNYASSHPAFPHESTANQWFGEAQFESYRMLGFHSIHELAIGCGGTATLGELFESVASLRSSVISQQSSVVSAQSSVVSAQSSVVSAGSSVIRAQ